MGRPRKLLELDRLDGNPSRRLMIDSGIEAFGVVFVPEHLSDDARGCIEVIRLSMPPKIYSALDSFLLSAFGMAWAIHKRASHELNDPEFKWLVPNSAGNLTPNPWLKVLNAAAGDLATLGDRLGLSPKARAGLHVPQPGAKSEFEGLLGGRIAPSASLHLSKS